MPVYEVSSLFIDTVTGQSIDVYRSFTIGNSDYSAFVTNWPKISRKWNDLKPKKATIKLANQDQTFNFFRTSPETLTNSCEVRLGVYYTPSSTESIEVFGGTIGRVSWGNNGTSVSISIVDKFKPFSERVVGTSDDPMDYTLGNYYPSDIAWFLVTSYGGLSSIQSSSNPDIDYLSWSDWDDYFTDNSVVVKAKFDGQKVMEGLRKIGRITGSSIYEENGRVTFARFNTSSVEPFAVGSGANLSIGLTMDDESIINKQIVFADYDTNSSYYKVVVNDEDTSSVNSFGLRERVEKDSSIWYVNSLAAIDYAQRSVVVNKLPKQNFKIKTGLHLLARAVGETVSLTADTVGINEDVFRIMDYSLDMDKCTFTAGVDTTQLRTFFVLDDAVLGLLDETYNPLG